MDEPVKVVSPTTPFDWLIYADATFAGLSVLIPVPLLDLASEWFFKRRIPKSIARRNGRSLPPVVLAEINQNRIGCLESCLTWPFLLVFLFVKRLSRKILYFLTIKEATDQLSYYWHRAFLLDYMMRSGYLEREGKTAVAAIALDQVLTTTTTSPLTQLAQQTIAGTRHIWRTLRRVRRGNEDEVVNETRSLMARTWDSFGDYFAEIAARYDQTYHQVEITSLAPPTTNQPQ